MFRKVKKNLLSIFITLAVIGFGFISIHQVKELNLGLNIAHAQNFSSGSNGLQSPLITTPSNSTTTYGANGLPLNPTPLIQTPTNTTYGANHLPVNPTPLIATPPNNTRASTVPLPTAPTTPTTPTTPANWPTTPSAQTTATPLTTTNSLHAELTDVSNGGDPSSDWIFYVWKITMGLANAFVAVILLFFAFVNIAHIEYDTYQIKKTLPKLIIGILLANFSMVICRMIADVASVITATFGGDNAAIMGGVMKAMGVTGGVPTIPLLDVLGGGLMLIWAIIVMLLIFIAILILGILLLVRHVVILILAATAPIAFILLAFPPTEQYFKKWWEWEVNWVFMGPIIMLLLWMAGKIGLTNASATTAARFSFTKMAAALGLVYLAAIVPFKLGGSVMGAVGNLGKKAGSAAWNNPWSERQKKLMGSGLKEKFSRTGLGRRMSMSRMAQENTIANNEGLVESRDQQNLAKHLEKNKDKQKNIDNAIRMAKGDVDNIRLEMELEVKQGNLGDKLSDKFIRNVYGIKGSKTKGMTQEEVRKKYLDQRQKTSDMKNGMEKEESETLLQQAGVTARNNEELKVGTENMAKVQSDYDPTTGAKLAVGAPRSEQSYVESMNAITELEFKAKEKAGTDEGRQAHEAATHLREKTAQYRKNNTTYPPGTTIDGRNAQGEKINYDAFMDKNLAGRQMKTMGQGMSEEAKTLQTSFSHTGLLAETKKSSFSNGRFKTTDAKHRKMLIGRSEGLSTNEREVSTEFIRAQFENAKAASSGSRPAVESQQLFIQQIQEAHAAEGTGLEVATEVRAAAMEGISDDAKRHMKLTIMMQANPTTYAPKSSKPADIETARARAVADYDNPANVAARDAALKSFDARRIETSTNSKESSWAKEYLTSTNTALENRDDLMLSGNPGGVVKKSKP